MNRPSKELISEIAQELSVNPSFIEKDFYAVKILEKISSFSCLGFFPVFSGGTSLSKAYGLIKRFSEDLDFNFYNTSHLTEGQRRTIRYSFTESIKSAEDIVVKSATAANGGRKETITVSYPKQFETPNQLRDELQIELFFDEEENTSVERRQVSSFIGLAVPEFAEKVDIVCNSPFNIMADKFNALTWRVYREDGDFDYTLMRHLHDLYALATALEISDKFQAKVLDNFEKKDKHRLKNQISFKEILKETNRKLAEIKAYKNGYIRFADSMSYAPDNERITFELALKKYQELSRLFL